MTTNELETLIYTIGEADNTPELILSLKPFLPGPTYIALSLAFDMCPIHDQDLDSCADDDTLEMAEAVPFEIPFTACRHLRNA